MNVERDPTHHDRAAIQSLLRQVKACGREDARLALVSAVLTVLVNPAALAINLRLHNYILAGILAVVVALVVANLKLIRTRRARQRVVDNLYNLLDRQQKGRA
jgi:hypothetical protein